MKASGIRSSYLIVDPTRRTVLKERVVSERQQLVRIDYESLHGINEEIEKQALRKIKELLPKVDAVIVEDYAKGTVSGALMKAIFNLGKKAGKTVAVDPNLRTPPQNYRGASILTPNTREAEHLSGIYIRDEASLEKAGFTILKSTQAEHVVITRGKDGMAIFSRGSSRGKTRGSRESTMRLIPTWACEVYDVSGAGDTVIAVMSLCLVSGATIEEASVLGNLAAGVEVGKKRDRHSFS